MRRLLLLLLAVLCAGGPAVLVGAAHAQPAGGLDIDAAATALPTDPLLVVPGSGVRPDEQAVRAALEGTRVPVYAVVVPQAAADAQDLGIDGLVLRLVEALDDPEAVVLVVTDGQELQAGDGGSSGVDTSAVLDEVLADTVDQPFGPESLTAAVVAFARGVDEGVGELPPARTEPAGSARRTVGLVGLITVVALGGGGWLYLRGQRRALAGAPLTRHDLTPEEPGWQGVSDR